MHRDLQGNYPVFSAYLPLKLSILLQESIILAGIKTYILIEEEYKDTFVKW